VREARDKVPERYQTRHSAFVVHAIGLEFRSAAGNPFTFEARKQSLGYGGMA